ncbi:hypothetical protein F0562_033430 [Nyssa sinensis]|uniref:Mediator of RNA polymerase II transcription subunit 18 n=1 Tax=Nyssa sinensis TaxID=561372 RepID=A0A5J5AGV4_9ASTE|nr:hypothetical protein F0562_033430 [Nyssa sinensis]
MQAASLQSLLLPARPFSGNLHHKPRLINPTKKPSTAVFASKRDAHDRDYDGRLVDEDMIVLRKRIHEMKMVERNYEPPSGWMEWEKRYYNSSYDSDICEAMEYLQTLLMETRPSLALGMVALIALSVPTSTALIAFQLMEVAKVFLGALLGAGMLYEICALSELRIASFSGF